jgi:predicted metal-dependent hydrolase
MTSRTVEALERGRVLFNAGSYFEAHEVWEEAWLQETGEPRRLLQGLIQIAAALHKAARGERARGCVLLLEWGSTKLEGIADSSAGLALGRFRARLKAFRKQVEPWGKGDSGPPSGALPRLSRMRPRPRRTVRARRVGTRKPFPS